MGGREQFAQVVAAIFTNIDEPKIASQILDKIGFKRAIPMPENDVPPLAPAGEPEPMERGKDPSQDPSREVPAHVAIMASLVRGVKQQVKAEDDKMFVERSGGRWVGWVDTEEGRHQYRNLPQDKAQIERWAKLHHMRVIWDTSLSDMASKSAPRENIKKMLGAATAGTKENQAFLKKIKLPTGWEFDESAVQDEGIYAIRKYRNDYQANALITDLDLLSQKATSRGEIIVSLKDYGGYEDVDYNEETLQFRSIDQIPSLLKRYEQKIVKERPWLIQ